MCKKGKNSFHKIRVIQKDIKIYKCSQNNRLTNSYKESLKGQQSRQSKA